jgi:hypothetical protein
MDHLLVAVAEALDKELQVVVQVRQIVRKKIEKLIISLLLIK